MNSREFYQTFVPDRWIKIYPDSRVPRYFAPLIDNRAADHKDGGKVYVSNTLLRVVSSEVANEFGKPQFEVRQIVKPKRNETLFTEVTINPQVIIPSDSGFSYLEIEGLIDHVKKKVALGSVAISSDDEISLQIGDTPIFRYSPRGIEIHTDKPSRSDFDSHYSFFECETDLARVPITNSAVVGDECIASIIQGVEFISLGSHQLAREVMNIVGSVYDDQRLRGVVNPYLKFELSALA